MRQTFTILVAALLPFMMNAQWSGNPNVADTKVCVAPGAQERPQGVTDGSGGAIIFWESEAGVFYNKFSDNPLFDYVPCAKFGDGYTDVYPAKTINVDITNIQFEENSFDVIYCSHVLEHVPNDLQAMKEFHRVLKPGGWAMLEVPLDKNRIKTYEDFSITDSKEREQAFGQYDHVRVYGMDYIERLKLAGFQVNQIDYTSEFNGNEIFTNGFQKDEDIFICSKQ